MPFPSINSSNQRTNPWNFHEKYWELAELENEVFLSWPFWIFFQKKTFFCFILMKTWSIGVLVSKDFLKFWWLPWFAAPNSTCLNKCNTVYLGMLHKPKIPILMAIQKEKGPSYAMRWTWLATNILSEKWYKSNTYLTDCVLAIFGMQMDCN